MCDRSEEREREDERERENREERVVRPTMSTRNRRDLRAMLTDDA